MHGGGPGLLMLKRSESNSCYAKALKRLLYGEVETQRGVGGGVGGGLPIAVLDNSEATLHIATVLGRVLHGEPSILGIRYASALILLCKHPNHTHAQARQCNTYNYTN